MHHVQFLVETVKSSQREKKKGPNCIDNPSNITAIDKNGERTDHWILENTYIDWEESEMIMHVGRYGMVH